ncbi:unnamed protein product [Phytophthora fragariaefolia]|uniref:Unnamed protein product n=1 Tax=Phytophthora fragariaefolia TaxID=1490495 RepID=A0A9W6X4Y7_9STRA|nr:unnamed protein product [Phytophthora fragariaefolia]
MRSATKTRPRTNDGDDSVSTAGVSTTSSHKRQRYIREVFDNVFAEDDLAEFERLLIHFQADNCLPDRFIERQSTRRLFEFLNKDCLKALPKGHDLGGRILDKHSTHAEEDELNKLWHRQKNCGGRVNLLCNMWQNIAKAHLLGCQLALFGIVAAFGLYPTGARYDGAAIAQEMEKVMATVETKGWKIGGVVTDDDAGQCGRARRILALRHPRVAFVHCFANDISNLVKAVLNTACRKLITQASLATVTLNVSSSKWSIRAKAVITETYGKPLGFINLCETRWNSMQGCFASLLRVRNALQQFATRYIDDVEFPEPLRVFCEPVFWSNLAAVEEIIRPLSNVSYKLQRGENTLADVVESYRDIYRGFMRDFDNMGLVVLVEKRWHRCEQPLMLLALFLHPRHVCLAVAIHKEAPRLLFLERLCGYGVYYYRRYFEFDNTEEINDLAADMHAWYRGHFVDKANAYFNGDVAQYWSFAADLRPKSKLPELAVVILSIAANTATCERYFSELASIHTAIKNRMKIDTARKLSLVRKAVRELDKVEDGMKEYTTLKRIVVAAEETRIGNCGSLSAQTSKEIEESHVIEHQETPSLETPEYWHDIFDVLDSDEAARMTAVNDNLQTQEEPLTTHMELNQIVYSGYEEDIPEPDTTEYPPINVKTFPSETKLTGIRGQKFSLSTLFPTENTFGLGPYLNTFE